MGWKNIKETFCMKMDVFFDAKEKDIQIYFYGNKSLLISTINFEVTAYPIVKSAYPLKSLLGKLLHAKQSGELKRLYDEPDKFAKSLSVYTVKENKIIKDFCEQYGYNKPTHSGERMNNTFFTDRKYAVEYLRKTATENLKNAFKYSFLDNIKDTFRGVWKLIKCTYLWIKARM